MAMDEDTRLPNYDPAFHRNVAKWGATICFVAVIVEICIFSLVDPTRTSCPDWKIQNGGEHPISLGVIFALTLFPAFWACFVFLRWKLFSKLIHASAMGTPPFIPKIFGNSQIDRFTFPHNQVFLAVLVLWCIFCTSPLWLMLFNCTGLARYLL
jgi:hypothetical protein